HPDGRPDTVAGHGVMMNLSPEAKRAFTVQSYSGSPTTEGVQIFGAGAVRDEYAIRGAPVRRGEELPTRGLPGPGGSVMTKPFHLAWFLHGSSAQSWGELWTGHIGTTWMQPELFLNMARTLERACFDYLLLEDASAVNEAFDGSTEIYLKRGIAVPRQDKSIVAALMAQVTSRIGIVPTLGTYAYHPYLLARVIATLDQVSGGRIGWNVVTGSSDSAARNFGMESMPEHDLRYDMADEYMEVVRGLWDTWEPGAIVADRQSGILVDHTKVHRFDYS